MPSACMLVANSPSGAGPCWQHQGGADSERLRLSPAASASLAGLHLENQAESQEILSYALDAAINFFSGLGQLVSSATLGFSSDKVGKIVSIVDL